MALPAAYNEATWGGSDANHQGVCPAGWHIPTDAEWTILENAVGGEDVAGMALKSTSGWNEGGNGTDVYGFSALPAGDRYSSGNFGDVGAARASGVPRSTVRTTLTTGAWTAPRGHIHEVPHQE